MRSGIQFWQVTDERLFRLAPMQFRDENKETRLQKLIAADHSMLGVDLTIVGKEVIIPEVDSRESNRLDLLAQTSSGGLVIIEFKRDKTTRDAVAQILDYSSHLQGMTRDEIRSLSGITDEIRDDESNQEPELILVAENIDPAADRIIKYLASKKINISVVSFAYTRLDDGRELFARTIAIPQVPRKAAKSATQTGSHYPSLSELLAVSDRRNVRGQFEVLRQLTALSWKEARFDTNGGTARYSVQLPRGKSSVLIGMNLGGERINLPNGDLDVWIRPGVAADYSGNSIEQINNDLRTFEKTVDTGRIGLLLKNKQQAETLLKILTDWDRKSEDGQMNGRSAGE